MKRLILTATALLLVLATGHAVIAAGEREIALIQLQSLAAALRTQGHTMTWGEVHAGGLAGPGATVDDVLVKLGTGDIRISAKTVAFSGMESLRASDIGVEIITERFSVPFLGTDEVSGKGSIAELTIDKPDFAAIAMLFATDPVQLRIRPFTALEALTSEKIRFKDLTFKGQLGSTAGYGNSGPAHPGQFRFGLSEFDLQGFRDQRFQRLDLTGWTMAAERNTYLGPVRVAIDEFHVTDGDLSRPIAAYEQRLAGADLLELGLGFGYRTGEMTGLIHEDKLVTMTTEKVTWETVPSPLPGFKRVIVKDQGSVTVARDGSERFESSSNAQMDFSLDRREVAMSLRFRGDDWFDLLADGHVRDIPTLPANDPFGLESQTRSGLSFAPVEESGGPAIIENWRSILKVDGQPNPIFALVSGVMLAHAQGFKSASVMKAAEAVQAFAQQGGELQTEIQGPVTLTSETLLRALDSSKIAITHLVTN